MNKKITASAIIVGLFALASFSSASVTIPNPLGGVDNFCKLLTSIAAGVGGVVASLGTIMLIWAGILYLTSAGSPDKMGKAKSAVIYAVVGMVVGLAATAIVEVIKSVIGANGGSC